MRLYVFRLHLHFYTSLNFIWIYTVFFPINGFCNFVLHIDQIVFMIINFMLAEVLVIAADGGNSILDKEI